MQTAYNSPIGSILLQFNDSAITGLYFKDNITEQNPLNETAKQCIAQLDEYFSGQRKLFNVAMELNGTPFRMAVWRQLLEIPYGQTASYKDIAAAVQNSKAVRAVGGANHSNPISIIVPCHRVIAANGGLGGYGGEIWRKKWLLEHEKNNVQHSRGARWERVNLLS